MTSSIEIFAGPAGSGKTARALQIYQAALARAPRGQLGCTLWLAPTHRARRLVRQRLLGPELTACFSPNVFTFDEFAEKILRYSSAAVTPITSVMQRSLLSGIVAAHLEQGRLKHFRSIAHTSGFLDLVSSLIAELKRDEVWPDVFSAACRKRGRNPGDAELANLYEEYQEQLRLHDWYDSEGRFWWAREQLQAGNWGQFPEFELVVADGFTDFTLTQYEILSLLAVRSQQAIVTLPLERSNRCRDLFAKTATAVEQLTRLSFGSVAVTYFDATDDAKPAGLRQIARQLFTNPRETQRGPDAAGIAVLEVAGQLGEVRAIAGRIKRLLLSGTKPAEIVVAFRNPADYRDLVEEVFTASGIPFACDAGVPLARAAQVRAVLTLLQLEAEDWPFRRLTVLLGSSCFQPRWSEWNPDRSPSDVAAELRRLKLHVGRKTILKALDDIAKGESAGRATWSAAALLNRLSAATARLRSPAGFAAWVDHLSALARELGFAGTKGATTPEAVADREVWDLFEGLLHNAAKTAELLPDTPRRLTLAEFLSVVLDLLQTQVIPSRTPEDGRVRVLEATQIRSLDVPILFLGGLSEDSFPARRSDDCVLSEADRRELLDHGVTLLHRTSQAQAEMLLFYGVVTRAERALVLSYPAVSTRGQPLAPSPYVTALLELFDPGAVSVTRDEQLDPVPPVDELLHAGDLRVAATAETLAGRPGLWRAYAEREEQRRPARTMLAAVEMGLQRFRTRGFTSYEGLLSEPGNLEALRLRFPPEYEFSATHLESYATCPFRFWMSRVLRIESLESPVVNTDFRRRGVLVHQVLSDVHQELRERLQGMPAAEIGAALAEFQSVGEQFREKLQNRIAAEYGGSELQQALLNIEEQLLAKWGVAYGDQWTNYLAESHKQTGAALMPAAFEIEFGTPREAPVTSEATENQGTQVSRSPALVLGEGAGAARIGGRIDRIDVGQIGDSTVYSVIDYKTGKPPKFSGDDVALGRTLQLVLYSLAVQRLGIVGADAVPFQAGYWCLRAEGFHAAWAASESVADGIIESAEWSALCASVEAIIPRLALGIRQGQFPVYNRDDNCTGYCEYKTVCRVNQIRPLAEKLEKHWGPQL